MFYAPALRRIRTAASEPWLRRLLPRSMFGRSLLIVILPLVILQAVLAYVFYDRHWDTVTRWLAVGVAAELGLLVQLIEEADNRGEQTAALRLARNRFGFAVSLEPEGRLQATGYGLRPEGHLETTLYEHFARQITRPFAVDTRPVGLPERIAVYVQLDDGLLRVLAPRKRVDSTTTKVFISWMVGLSLLLLALAIFFMTRQVRPIRRLAWAADNFGKGRDVGDFKLEGAIEIRRAGTAFNLMRKRILRHIAQRTELLAAVSHDLRTPLTRMKLDLEMLPAGRVEAADLDEMRNDLAEMANVIDGYLAFARGEGQETIVPSDLGSLLEEVAERARKDGLDVHIELERPIVLPLRPIACRRCISNLLSNATRYATDVRIRATLDAAHVWIAIDDNGPGIPLEQREAVFRPFHRLDHSRNPATGGVGLGLTIARDIVLGQGGDIELHDAPAGGLRVLVRLPR